jgi:hypothetical protein
MRLATLLLVALAAPPARADEPAPSPPPAESPPPPPAPDLTPRAPAAPLDFDLLPSEPSAAAGADPAFERLVARRRLMLKVHQGVGIATWTSLAATAVVGQLQLDDRFRGGGDTGRYRRPHQLLVGTSSALFLSAGLLALFAPEPYQKRGARLDTATLHKVGMGVATAGMLAQIVLGIAARRQAGSLRERDLATVHQGLGYATLGAFTVGAAVLFF